MLNLFGFEGYAARDLPRMSEQELARIARSKIYNTQDLSKSPLEVVMQLKKEDEMIKEDWGQADTHRGLDMWFHGEVFLRDPSKYLTFAKAEDYSVVKQEGAEMKLFKISEKTAIIQQPSNLGPIRNKISANRKENVKPAYQRRS
jgi:hypothetical protein